MDQIVNLSDSVNDRKEAADLILRDRLALVRTKLANERTLFAYVRTLLYLLTAGVGILEIDSIRHLKIIAYVSLFFSIFLFFRGLLRFWQLGRRLRDYVPKGPFLHDIPEQPEN